MKKVLLLILTSLGIITASNAMDMPSLSFVQAAEVGDESAIDAFLAGAKSKVSLEDGLNGLEAAINNRHQSIIQKIKALFCNVHISQELAETAIIHACSVTYEATAITMLELFFSILRSQVLWGIPPGDTNRIADDATRVAFTKAAEAKHLNIIKLLQESNCVWSIPITSLMIIARKTNYPDLAIYLLKSIPATSQRALCASSSLWSAAKESKLSYINALLAEQEITYYIPKENLELVATLIGSQELIDPHEKEDLKKTLEEIAYNNGWCVIL